MSPSRSIDWRELLREARERDFADEIRTFFRVTIWRRDSRDIGPVRGLLLRLCRVGYVFGHGSLDRNVLTSASALTFHTLLSMVPLLAVAFSFAKGFGFKITAVHDLLVNASGGQSEIVERLLNYVENTGVAALGAVGAMFLIYTAISVIGRIEKAFNEIWGVSQGRPFRRKVTDYLTVLLFFPLLLILATTINGTLGSNAFISRFLDSPGVVRLIPIVTLWAAFTFVFVFLTHTKVKLRAAMIGGLMTALIWQLAQWGYINFQVGVSKYNAIYGTFAALPIFLVWLNLSWMIVLLGSEVAYAVQHESTYHPQPPEGYTLSIARQEQVALQFVARVWRRFGEGGKPYSSGDLLAEVDVPRHASLEILDALVGAGLLARAAEPEDGLLPARDLNQLSLGETLLAFRHLGEGDGITHEPGAVDEQVTDLHRKLEEAFRNEGAESLPELTTRPKAREA